MKAEQPEFEGYHVAMINVEKLNALETAARREQARVMGRAIVVAVREAGRHVLRLFTGGSATGHASHGLPTAANRNHDNRAAA